MYVMWGQTEAAPRMSTLPASQTSAKLGSVGPALDGGHISVETADGVESVEPGVRGEVIYRGSNVMWGYARSAADLGEGDQVGGILRTGDLGWLDNEGCLWLTGRISRIGKVCGIRVNLDDVERILEPMGRFAAVECDDRLLVFGVDLPAAIRARAREVLSRALRLHRSGFVVESVESLPHLANGKPDYRALKRGLV